MGVVSKEMATKEVNGWLDFQDVSSEIREKYKTSVNKMIESVESGKLKIDPTTFVITQTLKFPIGKEVKITELKFQPGLTVGALQSHMLGVGGNDTYGQVFAYISATTGEMKTIIAEMNNKDYKISDAIIVFFML